MKQAKEKLKKRCPSRYLSAPRGAECEQESKSEAGGSGKAEAGWGLSANKPHQSHRSVLLCENLWSQPGEGCVPACKVSP